jgi:protein tyrosine/serine phosphatase
MAKKKNDFMGPVLIAVIVGLTILAVRHFHIKHFRVVQPGVLYTSGQPRGMDYTRLLYKYHIATIINLREADEHREELWYNEEVTWVRENGVDYYELPITKRPSYFPDKKTQKKFLEIMTDEKSWPVLIHDSAGKKRVSMMAAVWLIKQQGYTIEKTYQVVRDIKGSSPTKEEKEFIKQLAKGSAKTVANSK